MNTQKLADLNPGDAVAFRQNESQPWYKVRVVAATARCVVIDYDTRTKFWKTSGLTTCKEYPDSQISNITPEIQEIWDRQECRSTILRTLEKRDDISAEVLKKMMIKLVQQSKCRKFDYNECVKHILCTDTVPSDCLIGAIEMLSNK